MPSLNDLLENTQGDRYKCPICNARRGVSIDPDEGDTGVAYCFSCRTGWTGAQLYAEIHHVEIGEALQAFGVEPTDDAVHRARKRRKDRTKDSRNHTDSELVRVERAKRLMTVGERLRFRNFCQTRARQYTAYTDMDGEDICDCGAASFRSRGGTVGGDDPGKYPLHRKPRLVMRVPFSDETTRALEAAADHYVERALSRKGPTVEELRQELEACDVPL